MIHTFDTGNPGIHSSEYPFSNNPDILTTPHIMLMDEDHFMIIGTSRTRETDKIIHPKFEIIGSGAIELGLDEPFGYRYGNDGGDRILVLESPKVASLRVSASEVADTWSIEVESEVEKLSGRDKAAFLTGLTEHIRFIRER